MMDPLFIFIFLGLFSPGPNVIMLTTAGARFGFHRTVPHLAGVAVGTGIIAGLTGLGVGALLLALPSLTLALKWVAAAWILWLAWRLWTSTTRPRVQDRDRPFTFIEAVLFQRLDVGDHQLRRPLEPSGTVFLVLEQAP